MTRRAIETQPSTRLRWVLTTLPVGLLALFAYLTFEWLFYVTKASFVSVRPAVEQLLVLLRAPVPFVAPIFILQCVATLLSLLFYPRIRVVAALPAAALLSALVLILADNFLYAIAQMSLVRSELIGRLVYGLILTIALVVWLGKLRTDLERMAGSPRSIAILWLPATAMLAAALTGEFAATAPSPNAAAAERKPNVLLLSIDGVDARRLSAYGYRHATSPFLASIRDETLFCENAFSNAIETYTSQTSFLTGKLPFTTRVVVPPAILRGDDAVEHLPGVMRRAGYRSIQLSLRHIADAEDANMRFGFELTNYRWENPLSRPAVERTHDIARAFRLAAVDRLYARLAALAGSRLRPDQFAHVTGAEVNPYWSDARRVDTLAWFVAQNDSRPWFAHVHLLDTHAGHHEKPGESVTSEEQYDALLREADDRVRQIFAMLAARGDLERTVVVITTDHGSSLRFAQVPRIPLMIRFPGGRHARREARNTQLIDVAPTVLDAIGIPPPAWMEGHSLLRNNVSPSRPVFASGTVAPLRARGVFRLPLPGAPHYGARTALMIAGSWWYSLDLTTGEITSGAIDGHTRPTPPLRPDEARASLADWLSRSGMQATAAAGS